MIKLQVVSDDFNKSFKAPTRNVYVRVKMADVKYTEKDINNLTVELGSMGGSSFQIGSTFSNTLKIEFSSVIEGLKELDEIEIEIGIMTHEAILPTMTNLARVGTAKVGAARLVSYVPNKYEYVKIGKFYIDKVDPNRDDKKTTVEAFDGFTFMESAYSSKLKYPASIRDVALEIANLSGTKIDEVSFARLSSSKIVQPKGYTYRQAIGLIAQFEAGFATFNKEGLLEIRTLQDPKFNVSPNEYFMSGLKKSEILYRLGGIVCRVRDAQGEEKELRVGSKEGTQIELENNVMTQSLLDSIYNKIKDVNYYPYNLNWRGNPALEVGDWLTLTDTMGTKFKVPNLSYQLTFNGGLTATSSADTTATSDKVSKYRSPLDQKLNDIYVQIDAAGKNNIYRGLDEPEYPKEGDLWFKPNGPDKEIWVYTKNADGTFEWKLETSTALNDDIREQIENATPSDEIVKTINLSNEMDGKEWLKINGAKLWLTDQTKIDNAIITSAMIADINAGKINTGTLNAANVNIINLNADNIVSGTLTAIDIVGSKIISRGTGYEMTSNNGSLSWTRRSDGAKVFDFFANTGGSLVGAMTMLLQSNSSFTMYTPGSGITNPMLSLQENSSKLASLRSLTIGSISINNSGNASDYITHTHDKNGFDLTSKNSAGMASLKLSQASGLGISVSGTVTGTLSINNSGFSINISQSKDAIVTSRNFQFNNSGTVQINKNLSVFGTKNAVHVTRDGVRATPAYETAESYLGDIGRAVTGKGNQIWIEIEELFGDTVNTDIPYEVFIQAYDDAKFWVADFKSGAFLVCSDKPLARFAWEIKAKRLGYESDRLVKQDIRNKDIENIYK